MLKQAIPFLCVGAGGFFGALLRYSVTLLSRGFAPTYPLGTLLSNFGGCLIIGAFVTLATRTSSLPSEVYLLVATGVCGGFTTMSSFIYEVMQFMRDGEVASGAGYFAATLAGSCAGFVLGVGAIRFIARG